MPHSRTSVFLVVRVCYYCHIDGVEVDAVFSTRRLANAYMKALSGGLSTRKIVTLPLDFYVTDFADGKRAFYAKLRPDGSCVEVVKETSSTLMGLIFADGKFSIHRVWAKNEQDAVKIAQKEQAKICLTMPMR